MIEISIQDNATPTIRKLIGCMNPQAVNQVAGRSGANVMKSWLRDLESSRPNALGGARTHFWGKAASAVGYEAGSDGATVYTAATGVLYQRFGGTLKPSGRVSSVTGKAIVNLAIPARAEAHGKVPSDFNNLIPLIRRRNGKPTAIALVEAESQDVTLGKPRKDGTRKVKRGQERGGGVLFWLVKQAQKDPDEGVFPPDDLIRDAVQLHVLDYIMRNVRRAA